MNNLLTPAEVDDMWQESLYDLGEEILWECRGDCFRVGAVVLVPTVHPGYLIFRLEDANE